MYVCVYVFIFILISRYCCLLSRQVFQFTLPNLVDEKVKAQPSDANFEEDAVPTRSLEAPRKWSRSGWGKHNNLEVAQSARCFVWRESLFCYEAKSFFFFLSVVGWTLFYGKQNEIENQLFNSAFLAEEIEKIIHFWLRAYILMLLLLLLPLLFAQEKACK